MDVRRRAALDLANVQTLCCTFSRSRTSTTAAGSVRRRARLLQSLSCPSRLGPLLGRQRRRQPRSQREGAAPVARDHRDPRRRDQHREGGFGPGADRWPDRLIAHLIACYDSRVCKVCTYLYLICLLRMCASHCSIFTLPALRSDCPHCSAHAIAEAIGPSDSTSVLSAALALVRLSRLLRSAQWAARGLACSAHPRAMRVETSATPAAGASGAASASSSAKASANGGDHAASASKARRTRSYVALSRADRCEAQRGAAAASFRR